MTDLPTAPRSPSHPPTLITLATRLLTREARLPRGSRLLIAISGGPDSMALLDVLARLRPKTGLTLVAHGVDHGLRDSAAAELDLAEAHAKALDVPFGRTSVVVTRGGNLQARARDARYAALHAAASREGASVIATGHHADDRAETVLLRLLRGAGPRGLAVLPPLAPAATATEASLLRPLLRARRSDIDAHIARHGIPFATDPSNVDDHYARTRVRAELLPLLEKMSPSIVEHLCALSDQLQDGGASEAVAALMERADGSPYHPDALPRAVQLALAALVHFPRKKASVELPRGLVATFDRGKHKIVVGEPSQAAGPHASERAERTAWPAWKHREGNGRHHNER